MAFLAFNLAVFFTTNRVLIYKVRVNSLFIIVKLCRGLEGLDRAIEERIKGREVFISAGLLISYGWPKQVRHLAYSKGINKFRIIVGIP